MSCGWEYIVVDIRWYVQNDKAGGYNEKDPVFSIDNYGRYIPAVNRFPSSVGGQGFKPLADYIHTKGLKFGIHLMRGIPKLAVQKKMPVKGTNITADQIYNTELLCTWLGDNYTVNAAANGAQEYYNSLFELYAIWGVDFVKIDDLSRPYHQDEIEMIRKAIDRCGRPIVLSTSPGETPLNKADHVFGIEKLKGRPFLTLSSGEQRLVLLARAFVKDPDLLILDEPLHGLDISNKKKVGRIIERFCNRPGKTLIYVTHYPNELPKCVDKHYELVKHT